MANTYKTCYRCKETKPIERFSKKKTSKDGHNALCKECSNKYRYTYYRQNREREIKKVNEWREKNPDYSKEYRTKNKDKRTSYELKRAYGISLEEKQKMIEEQNGLCAACGDPLGDSPRDICVDHCHTTGAVRKVIHRKW